MKNKLYEIFDWITMLFSPLVESLFDRAEVWSARRAARKSMRRPETVPDGTALREAPATGIRREGVVRLVSAQSG